MAGLLGDSFDDPRTLAVMQAAQGLLGGGSNASRFAGAGAAYAQQMQAERARKLLEDDRRSMIAERTQQIVASKQKQAEDEAKRAKAAQDEAIARRLFGAQQQMGMPTGQMGPEMPERTGGMINPQTFLQQGGSLGGLGGVSALNQLLAPKDQKPIISKRGDIARHPVTQEILWQNEDEPEKIDPNKPFMIGPDGKIVPNPEYQAYAERVAAAGATRVNTGDKPLPPAMIAQQDALIDKMTTARSIETDLASMQKRIEAGELKFGPVSNILNEGRNAAGMSTKESRNFATFKSTLEKMRNDSLRLNNGVQTEGDAQRAWNELFQNITDSKLVMQRLSEIREINKRAAGLHQYRLQVLRGNFGASELPEANIPPALDEAGSLSPDERQELEELRARFTK